VHIWKSPLSWQSPAIILQSIYGDHAIRLWHSNASNSTDDSIIRYGSTQNFTKGHSKLITLCRTFCTINNTNIREKKKENLVKVDRPDSEFRQMSQNFVSPPGQSPIYYLTSEPIIRDSAAILFFLTRVGYPLPWHY